MRATMPIVFHHNGLCYFVLSNVIARNPFDIYVEDTNVSDLRCLLFNVHDSSKQHGRR